MNPKLETKNTKTGVLDIESIKLGSVDEDDDDESSPRMKSKALKNA